MHIDSRYFVDPIISTPLVTCYQQLHESQSLHFAEMNQIAYIDILIIATCLLKHSPKV